MLCRVCLPEESVPRMWSKHCLHMVVADYPEDKPYSSRLILAWVSLNQMKLPLHVVVEQNSEDEACYVITAYIPSSELWHDDLSNQRPL